MTIFKNRRKDKLAETSDAVARQFTNARQLTIIGTTVYIIDTDGAVHTGRFKDGSIIDVRKVTITKAAN